MDINDFNQIFKRFQNMVYTIALRCTKNHDDALEIAQDVFLTVYQKYDDFRGDSKLSTWIYRIAVNKSLMHVRGRKYFSDLNDLPNEDYDFSTIENAIEQLKEQDRKLFVGKALSRLEPGYSVPLTLYYFEDLSVDEIAEIEQLSVSNVKVRLHRGRALLYAELEKMLKFETKSLLL
ncbi:RNA polymerase sigma factor [Tenuifilum thalassicum]|uniref:RNA polymerase sigma factor n=1 Tax=Tenuifilum thalassicum TaxID=2590900 RepID=A0A7D3XC57_9BACT|nr:sigma-70 family RNA polymerase sigma factor [Tenuifilum thalassicum]QKG78772.1 sigma-70 family RNA polymerase sigma factor [Tenuifilum thalassicum]